MIICGMNKILVFILVRVCRLHNMHITATNSEEYYDLLHV